MRFKKTDAQLLSEAASAIEGNEQEIIRLKSELFQIREKVNFFFFGPPDRNEHSIHIRGYGELSFTDQLKARAAEINKESDRES